MTLERFSLTGKVAMVTGGGRGIGKSIALALADAGADVVVTARTTEQIEAVAAEIRARGRNALALTTDVSRLDSIESMVKGTLDSFGRIDVLVNNAAISPYYTRAEKITPEMWDDIMAVDLRGFFFCCQSVGKVMIEQKRGAIVNVSSLAGIVGGPRLAAYSAAKAGIIGITMTLAQEWAPLNIRVNAIAPGWVATEFTRGLRENPRLLEKMIAAQPMGRVAEAEEIAGAVVFLASDAASYVNGSTLKIAGGANSL